MDNKDNELVKKKNDNLKASVRTPKIKKAVMTDDEEKENLAQFEHNFQNPSSYRYRDFSHRIKYGGSTASDEHTPVNIKSRNRTKIKNNRRKLIKKNLTAAVKKQNATSVMHDKTSNSSFVKPNSQSNIVKASIALPVQQAVPPVQNTALKKLHKTNVKRLQRARIQAVSKKSSENKSVIKTDYKAALVSTQDNIAKSAKIYEQHLTANPTVRVKPNKLQLARRKLLKTRYKDTLRVRKSSYSSTQALPRLVQQSVQGASQVAYQNATTVAPVENSISDLGITDYKENLAQFEQNFKADNEIIKNPTPNNLNKVYKKSSRIKFDKKLAREQAKKLDISLKSEMHCALDTNVTIVGRIGISGIKSTKNAMEDAIESNAENDMGIAAIDGTIKTTHTTVRTISNTAKGSTRFLKGTIAVGKTTFRGFRTGFRTVKKINKYRKLSQRAKNLYRQNFYRTTKRKIIRKVKETISNFKRSLISQLCAFMMMFLIIFFINSGFMVVFIASTIFQTESVLDTTQLVKYISKLDKDMQNDWYKGKTAAEITKYNDTPNARYNIKYDYFVAYNKLPDTLPAPDDTDPDLNCYVKIKRNPENGSETVGQKGYTLVAHSKDEFLEECRWTTDDYISALAYLQIQNENLGWFSSTFGWVGEAQLKAKAEELHELTYGSQILVNENAKTDEISYSLETGAVLDTDTFAGDTRRYCYFGRKNSVRFVIENDLIAKPLTEDEKERFESICKYGNSELAIMSYPLDGDIDIAKHFGEQIYLKFNAATDAESYPSVSKATGKHYAVDLNAGKDDIIKSPLSGYCKVTQQDKRGFEFVISTHPDFETGEYGYICKISCAASPIIPTNAVVKVNAGDSLGRVADILPINYEKPTAETDVFADKLYPCGTNTNYHSCDSQGCTEADYTGEYVHLELYKLPCDFTSASDMEKNVLAPELFFIYPEN